MDGGLRYNPSCITQFFLKIQICPNVIANIHTLTSVENTCWNGSKLDLLMSSGVFELIWPSKSSCPALLSVPLMSPVQCLASGHLHNYVSGLQNTLFSLRLFVRVLEDPHKVLCWSYVTSNECCTLSSASLCSSHLKVPFYFIVSPARAGKTGSLCWLLLSVVKMVNIWLYLPHALMDFNQSWVIDATWEPSFVDEVKGNISRSKVIWGQVVR